LYTFQIETSLICNLKCPECAIGAGRITRTKRVMKYEQFQIIASKINKITDIMYLFNFGEPFLNEDIFDIISLASGFSKTSISTNAILLDEEKAKALINSGIREIIVSIDGVTPEVYEKYRVGGDLNRVLNNLKLLIAFNREAGNKVRIVPQMVVFRHNQHEIPAFISMNKQMGLKPYLKSPDIKDFSKFQYADRKELQRAHFQTKEACRQAMKTCQMAKNWVNVQVDGTTVPCCMDYQGVMPFGNLLEQDACEVLENPAYLNFRNAVITGNAPAFCLEYCQFYNYTPENQDIKWLKI